MDTQVTFGILAGCVALAAVLVLLSLHILRRDQKICGSARKTARFSF